ncbi:MAG: hypothetical protein WCO68_11380 [Verrucomicrobiota bacterium]
MNFEEFQHLARLSIVGALDPEEAAQFQAGRREFGAEAEAFLAECRKLNAVFALSLRPCEPDPRTKARLFARIQGDSAKAQILGRDSKWASQRARSQTPIWERTCGRNSIAASGEESSALPPSPLPAMELPGQWRSQITAVP